MKLKDGFGTTTFAFCQGWCITIPFSYFQKKQDLLPKKMILRILWKKNKSHWNRRSGKKCDYIISSDINFLKGM